MRLFASVRAGGAHGRQRPALRPRRFAPSLLAATALALLVAAAAEALPAPRLRALLKEARVAVAGEVASVTEYDDGRVAVVALAVETTFKGDPAPGDRLALADLREGATRPHLRQGERGLAFLRPAARNSYLTRTLPAGTYLELLPEFGAFVAADSPAELARQQAIMKRLVAVAQGAPLDAAGARSLTFELLACDTPLLVEEGAAGVADLTSPLDENESRILRTALQRAEMPERVRLALVRAVGSAQLTAMAPTLQAIESPPAVMEAAWQALAAMGVAPPSETLTERLASRAPATRAAAVRELLRREGVAAISQVAPVVLQDPEPSVRRAGIDALGELGTPEALPPLERAFADNPEALRQAAARAILAIGGPPAVQTLARLANSGSIESQRYAVLVLMMIDDPSKTVVLERLAKTHDDEKIHDIIEHGISDGHSH